MYRADRRARCSTRRCFPSAVHPGVKIVDARGIQPINCTFVFRSQSSPFASLHSPPPVAAVPLLEVNPGTLGFGGGWVEYNSELDGRRSCIHGEDRATLSERKRTVSNAAVRLLPARPRCHDDRLVRITWEEGGVLCMRICAVGVERNIVHGNGGREDYLVGKNLAGRGIRVYHPPGRQSD